MAYDLGFITDADLFRHVEETIGHLTREIDLARFEKNIIDPIRLVFEIHAYGKTPGQAVENEISRQLGKTLENAIGWFHQFIFNYIKGWSVPADGVDVINDEKTVFGEIKNKFNTMNSSSAAKVFEKLRGIIIGNPNATAYLIEVIAKKSQDAEWHVPGYTLQPKKAQRIRRISIDRFYALATGDDTAFLKLCQVIGLVLDDVQRANPVRKFKNSVLAELQERDPDLVKSIFLSSFSTYNGFDGFHERAR